MIGNNQIFGQKAIDCYNLQAPLVQLSRFIGQGLYQECSLQEAESALAEARELDDDFILGNPEHAVMLTGYGYKEYQEIEMK